MHISHHLMKFGQAEAFIKLTHLLTVRLEIHYRQIIYKKSGWIVMVTFFWRGPKKQLFITLTSTFSVRKSVKEQIGSATSKSFQISE